MKSGLRRSRGAGAIGGRRLGVVVVKAVVVVAAAAALVSMVLQKLSPHLSRPLQASPRTLRRSSTRGRHTHKAL